MHSILNITVNYMSLINIVLHKNVSNQIKTLFYTFIYHTKIITFTIIGNCQFRHFVKVLEYGFDYKLIMKLVDKEI